MRKHIFSLFIWKHEQYEANEGPSATPRSKFRLAPEEPPPPTRSDSQIQASHRFMGWGREKNKGERQRGERKSANNGRNPQRKRQTEPVRRTLMRKLKNLRSYTKKTTDDRCKIVSWEGKGASCWIKSESSFETSQWQTLQRSQKWAAGFEAHIMCFFNRLVCINRDKSEVKTTHNTRKICINNGSLKSSRLYTFWYNTLLLNIQSILAHVWNYISYTLWNTC